MSQHRPPTPRAFRDVMGTFPTGVAIVATAHEGRRYGMTINSLTSISLDPMIVMVSLDTGSQTGRMIQARGAFTINLIGEHQEDLSRRFVMKVADRFEGVATVSRDDDLPVIAGTTGHLVARVMQSAQVGDHTVVYGEVTECGAGDHAPLVYFRGSYGRVTSWVKLRDSHDEFESAVHRRSTGWG
ncbi:MAG: flavin reductase [Hyphomicrobiales bacterium]|nr:MAG: flavin reductase [Hyphomicrobiales bacterium]